MGDHILVKGLSVEETSASGIIIPETVDKDRPERGEVVSVGPGRMLEDGKRSPMEVKPGDKVVFKKYAPDEIKVGKEEYLVIKMDDVVAVME